MYIGKYLNKFAAKCYSSGDEMKGNECVNKVDTDRLDLWIKQRQQNFVVNHAITKTIEHDTTKQQHQCVFSLIDLSNYFDFDVCLSIRSSVRPSFRPSLCVSENQLHFLQLYDKMSLITVAWYVSKYAFLVTLSLQSNHCC